MGSTTGALLRGKEEGLAHWMRLKASELKPTKGASSLLLTNSAGTGAGAEQDVLSCCHPKHFME